MGGGLNQSMGIDDSFRGGWGEISDESKLLLHYIKKVTEVQTITAYVKDVKKSDLN